MELWRWGGGTEQGGNVLTSDTNVERMVERMPCVEAILSTPLWDVASAKGEKASTAVAAMPGVGLTNLQDWRSHLEEESSTLRATLISFCFRFN